jgi:hypothetical protein
MKKTLLFGVLAAATCFPLAASAQELFVRNRPFKQAIKAGSETFVPADSFLRALGYNWSVSGDTVTLSQSAASNPTLPAGNFKFVLGDKSLPLELSSRGQKSFVSMVPLAKFLGFNVSNAGGITDVAKGRFSNETDKKLAAEVNQAKLAEEKATKEAWEKKAAEIKKKREDKEKSSEEGDKADEKDSKDAKDSKSETIGDSEKTAKGKKDKDKVAADAKAPVATDSKAEPAAAKDEKKNEPKPAARLEVFQAEATPDYSTGVIKIRTEVRNQGNGPSSGSVSGTLSLYGTSPDGKESLWYQTSIRGPVLKPDQNWTNAVEWKHRDGSAMPHGNLRVDLKMNS